VRREDSLGRVEGQLRGFREKGFSKWVEQYEGIDRIRNQRGCQRVRIDFIQG